ncbi:MAG TPA: polysaccharide pyruvyl transferase family protein [Candidatus Saccharimonadales bacterium]|nr:polysaccharide pyruvyl transferase family protein [Candidatus Saccharimonadales bacterium]
MKIAVIGSTLSGNKGAAAMLESSIQTIGARYPEATFTLFSYVPPEIERGQNTYKQLTVLKATPLHLGLVINPLALAYKLLPPLRGFIRSHSAAIKELAEADVLLDQGGITFVDGREKFLLYNVASILPALLVGTPVVKCAQALGPFNGRINRTAARIFLPRMALIVSRGSVTHGYLAGLGLKNIVAGADYAFLLELTETEKRAARKHFDPGFFRGSRVVGVSPSVVLKKKAEAAGQDYTGMMAAFIDYLAGRGYRVLLVPHSARAGTGKTHNNDLPLCREIYDGIAKPEECLFIDKELPSQELRYIIGRCDLFVASRFHAMVSSLAMEVPTLVIGWSHKYKEVLEMFGLEEWAFGLGELNLEYLERRFEALEKRQAGVRQKLAKNLPEVKKRSAIQVEEIARRLKASA